VVWDSLAIVEFLADRYGRELYWPEEDAARGMARSMAAEMHSGFANLRRELPMNVRKSFPPIDLSDAVREEINRILQLWAQARARFGGTGDFLFGDWCAADMVYAPVVTRFITYGVGVPSFAGVYMKAVLSHPHVAEWIDKAQDEPWVIDQWEVDKAA
jgi:glutathione S-transferase